MGNARDEYRLLPRRRSRYFLNKTPGYTGRFVALTASILKASDVLFIMPLITL